MAKHGEDWPWRVDPDELYHILIDTRNLEVNLFWQRTNYFLVLSSGHSFGILYCKRCHFSSDFRDNWPSDFGALVSDVPR